MSARSEYKRSDVLLWFFQRLSAVFLVGLIAMHVWLTHYSIYGDILNFRIMASRLKTPVFCILDFFILSLSVYHSLNGLRNVIFDYITEEKTKKRWNIFLLIIGILLIITGTLAVLKIFLYE